MTPITIARIITRLNIGGPSHHVMILTEALNDGEFSSRLMCGDVSPGEGDMTPEAVTRGIPLTRIPALHNHGGLIDALNSLWTIYRELRISRPEIVHLHQFKARLLGALAARVAGVPHVVQTYHGTLFQEYYRPALSAALMTVERCLGRCLVHQTIAVSEAVRRELVDRRVVRPDRVTVVPLGLTLAPFLNARESHGALRRELGIPPDAAVIGFVGRLVPIKAAWDFLAAAADVLKTVRGPAFAVVVGDGPDRRGLENQARAAGVADRVLFLGWRRDLPRIYADLDVLVLSSLNEGTPVAVIEAMAARCAVVATRVGGVPDVVDDERTGLLVAPRDPQGLAAAIGRVLQDDALRERLAAAGQASVYPKYDAATLCARMRRYYTDVTRK